MDYWELNTAGFILKIRGLNAEDGFILKTASEGMRWCKILIHNDLRKEPAASRVLEYIFDSNILSVNRHGFKCEQALLAGDAGSSGNIRRY